MSTWRLPIGDYHHGNLRQALIEGAREQIAAKGADGFTLRQLARHVGVSHTAAYRHFADKDALLVAVAEEAFAGLAEALQAAVDQAPDPLLAWIAAGRAYVIYAIEHPAQFQVMFRATALAPDHPSFEEVAGRAYEVLVQTVVAAQASGQLRAGPPEPIVLFSWATVHGLARLKVDGASLLEGRDDPEEWMALLGELMLNGVGAR